MNKLSKLIRKIKQPRFIKLKTQTVPALDATEVRVNPLYVPPNKGGDNSLYGIKVCCPQISKREGPSYVPDGNESWVQSGMKKL